MAAIKSNLLFVFLNIILTCVICSPLNGEENDGALTTERIEVFTSVSPPKSLCKNKSNE